jgi:anti-anti-sigma factor
MITVQNRPGSIVVCPMGDLDLAGSIHLLHQVAELVEPGLSVTIDLAHACFIDAAGLSAVAASVRRVRAAGGTASVTNASPRHRWLLRLTGSDRLVAPSSAMPRLGAA